MAELDALEKWAGGLLMKLAAPARRKVMLEVARELRRSQRTRIAAQKNPDNSAYEARRARRGSAAPVRDKKGRIKRTAMFMKLRTARYILTEATPQGAAIGFAGRVARVARVHQFGETDRVAARGATYKYPARVLLGFTDADRKMIRDILLKHITQ